MAFRLNRLLGSTNVQSIKFRSINLRQISFPSFDSFLLNDNDRHAPLDRDSECIHDLRYVQPYVVTRAHIHVHVCELGKCTKREREREREGRGEREQATASANHIRCVLH